METTARDKSKTRAENVLFQLSKTATTFGPNHLSNGKRAEFRERRRVWFDFRFGKDGYRKYENIKGLFNYPINQSNAKIDVLKLDINQMSMVRRGDEI